MEHEHRDVYKLSSRRHGSRSRENMSTNLICYQVFVADVLQLFLILKSTQCQNQVSPSPLIVTYSSLSTFSAIHTFHQPDNE